MVKIRLMRVGKRKQPSYRVVVSDSRSPRDGRIIEAIGHYNPRHEPSLVDIDTDRADYWLGVGAQPSDAVRKLLEIVRSGGGTSVTETQTEASAKSPAKAAPKVKATLAASVSEEPDEETGEVADLPEVQDQVEAAPEADTAEGTSEQ